MTVVPGARAQTAAVGAQADAADLRARQAELYGALSDDPSNLELMFAYASVSMRLEDYEAAITTLERMLFFNNKLSRVKLELAVAYFRLGVYDVARLHFQTVLAEDPPDEVVERIRPFLSAIEARTATHVFTGFVSVGGVYSTNANLGPPDREVEAEFFPGGVAEISADADEAADVGMRVSARLGHSYDLQKANDDAWLSSVEYTGVRYRTESAGDLDAIFVSTGPRLAVDDEAFGMKARPYVSAGYVRSDDEALYTQFGGGLELSETLTPELSVFGAGSIEWRDFYNDRDEFNGVYGAVFAGATLTPGRERAYSAALIARTDRTEEDFSSNNEIGVRVSAMQAVDVAGALDVADGGGPWRFTVFAQAAGRFFDAADPAVAADKSREDIDARIGGRMLAPIAGGSALAADVSYFRRFSNIRNFELRNLEVGLSFVQFF